MCVVDSLSNEQIVHNIKNGINPIENTLLLYKNNKGVIHNLIIRSGINNTDDIKDAEQNAFIGLSNAVKHYDETKNTKFLTLAAYYINKEIREGFRLSNCERCIIVPPHIMNLFYKVKKAERELCKKLGDTPTKEQLAKECDLSVKRIEALKRIFKPYISIYSPVNSSDDDMLLINYIADSTNIEENYEEKDLNNALLSALKSLPQLEQNMIVDLFYKGLSTADVAKKYGKGTATVHQKVNSSLYRMRVKLLLQNAYTR